MILYHWTPRTNIGSILRNGISPQFATGKMHVVWMADKRRAFGLLDCASRTHEVPARGFCLIRVNLPKAMVKRWSMEGVYHSQWLIPPVALKWVSPEVLWECLPLRIRRKR